MSKKLLFLFAFVTLSSPAFAEETPKPGTFYPYAELGIKKMEVKGSVIKFTFKPRDEQFYWCPGAKVKTTDKATVLTFVRCKTSQTCGVDAKAAIGKRLIRFQAQFLGVTTQIEVPINAVLSLYSKEENWRGMSFEGDDPDWDTADEEEEKKFTGSAKAANTSSSSQKRKKSKKKSVPSFLKVIK